MCAWFLASKNVRVVFGIGLLGLFASVPLGCAVTTGELMLTPPISKRVDAGQGVPVYIRTVEDHREFVDHPANPNIPSVRGGKEGASDAELLRAIARKRNSYGAAMGNILLPEGQSVVGLVMAMLQTAVNESGNHVVTSESAATGGGVILDVDIDQLWGWFNPGFWAISVEVEIETKIDPVESGQALEPMTIFANAKRTGQSAGTQAWTNVFNDAMDNFVTEAIACLRALL